MALFFTAVPVLLTFSSVFIPISLRGLKLAFVLVIYLSHLCYFTLCARGFMKMKENAAYDFPFISKYAKKVDGLTQSIERYPARSTILFSFFQAFPDFCIDI